MYLSPGQPRNNYLSVSWSRSVRKGIQSVQNVSRGQVMYLSPGQPRNNYLSVSWSVRRGIQSVRVSDFPFLEGCITQGVGICANVAHKFAISHNLNLPCNCFYDCHDSDWFLLTLVPLSHLNVFCFFFWTSILYVELLTSQLWQVRYLISNAFALQCGQKCRHCTMTLSGVVGSVSLGECLLGTRNSSFLHSLACWLSAGCLVFSF